MPGSHCLYVVQIWYLRYCLQIYGLCICGVCDSAALILLDLSAAFDTVDHSILLQRLQTTFGIHDAAHRWFHLYLSGRYQYIRRGSVRSSVIELICGVPQQTSSNWLKPSACRHIYMPTILKSTAPVHQQLWRYLRHRSLSAWMLLRRGWSRTGCS